MFTLGTGTCTGAVNCLFDSFGKSSLYTEPFQSTSLGLEIVPKNVIMGHFGAPGMAYIWTIWFILDTFISIT